MTLADSLRAHIDQSGLSIREVARRSGVSNSYLAALLSGTRERISVDKARAIARVLGIPVVELTGEEDSSRSINDLVRELSRRCDALGMVEVPVRGVIPCAGEAREQTGVVVVPRTLAAEGGDRLLAFEIGEALREERLEVGDYVIVDPAEGLSDRGGVFVMHVEGETVIRRAWAVGSHVEIRPPVGPADTLPSDRVKVVGRVVLGGRWRQY